MKTIFYIGVILFISVNSLEAQSYQANFKNDICQCIQDKYVVNMQTHYVYKQCFEESLIQYAPLIDAEINETNPTLKYTKGQEQRKKLQAQFKYQLVSSCNIYYNILEHEREQVIAYKYGRTDSTLILKKTKQIAMTPNAHAYFGRAQLYFNLKMWDKAEADLRKSIAINPMSKNAMVTRNEQLLLAWALEKQAKYAEAIAIYSKLKYHDLDVHVLTFKAIATRKSKGDMPQPVKITEKENITTKPKTPKAATKPKAQSTTNKNRRRVQRNSKRNHNTPKVKNATTKKDSVKNLKKLFKIDNY
ncbi:tetratricopeptide repeat protein [Lacinutrix salivirga]